MKERMDRIAESLLAGLPPKIRKTVPMNTSTRRHPDVTKYDKKQRQKWKQDLRREGRTAAKITSYPHRTQSFDYDCGATAVLTVMQYYGFNSDQLNEQRVFDSIGTDLNGTDNEGIEAGLLKMGMKYANVRTLADIDRHVDAGYPVVVSVAQWIEHGEPVWHYEVVIAQEGDRYIVSDPWALTLVWVEKAIFEKMWYEPKDEETRRWGVAVIGEPKFRGGVEMMDYKLASRREFTAHLLERLNPADMPRLWYETEDGEKWVPPMDQAWPGLPEGFVYQHSRFPNILRQEVLRVKADGTSERVMAMESTWREDLALALVRRGLTLSEAILVSATACERCMNVLADECGLDWGYSWGSAEAEKAHTECELCRAKELV